LKLGDQATEASKVADAAQTGAEMPTPSGPEAVREFPAA
jgi:hypothetical protein